MSNKDELFAMVRAVKVLPEELQKEAKKKGYKMNDIVLITRSNYKSAPKYSIKEKIDGSIVEFQREHGLVIKK